MTNKKANSYIAIVELSEKYRKRVKELYEVYKTDKKFYLKHIAIGLLHHEIDKEDRYDVTTIRELICEATSENNSTSLKNVLMCIAKGLYYCSEEELSEAKIVM